MVPDERPGSCRGAAHPSDRRRPAKGLTAPGAGTRRTGPGLAALLLTLLGLLTPSAGAQDAAPETTAEGAPPTLAERAQQASERFHASFTELLTEEEAVQEYERNSLGRVPAGQLKGARLERRRRLIKDENTWQARRAALPGRPLLAPRATQARRPLSAQETEVLRRLGQAYDLSRDTAPIEALRQHNQTFLAAENWVERDKAVLARDALIEREIAYAELINQGREILASGLPAAQLDRMTATLDAISPETRPERGSPIEQLMSDPKLQRKVQGELLVMLQQPLDLGLPEQQDAELLAALPGLQAALMQASGLVEAYAELIGLNAELATLESTLADRGVDALGLDARRAAVARKAELVVRQNELNFEVGHTPPSVPEAKTLIQVQDALIRRRLFDIGPRAALFAARYDTLQPNSFAALTSPDQWTFLEDQVALITALDKARPAPSPLEGLTWRPPPPGPVLKADLLGKLPKPGKPKKAPGGR